MSGRHFFERKKNVATFTERVELQDGVTHESVLQPADNYDNAVYLIPLICTQHFKTHLTHVASKQRQRVGELLVILLYS